MIFLMHIIVYNCAIIVNIFMNNTCVNTNKAFKYTVKSYKSKCKKVVKIKIKKNEEDIEKKKFIIIMMKSIFI